LHLTDAFDLTVGTRYARNDQDFRQRTEGILATIPSDTSTKESSESVVTYLVNPRYYITESVMVYGRFASGYRPGGPNFIVPPPLSPRCSTALTTSYERELWDCCSTNVGLSFRFVGRRPSGFGGGTVHPQYWLDGYGLLDLRAGFEWRAVDLALFLKNVFNTQGGVTADTSALQLNSDAPVRVTVTQPRMVGLTLTVRL